MKPAPNPQQPQGQLQHHIHHRHPNLAVPDKEKQLISKGGEGCETAEEADKDQCPQFRASAERVGGIAHARPKS